MNRNYRYNRDTGEFELIRNNSRREYFSSSQPTLRRDNSPPPRYYPGSAPPPYSDISSRGRLPSYSPGSNPDRFFSFTRSVRTPITISSGSNRAHSLDSISVNSSQLSFNSRGRRYLRRVFGLNSNSSAITIPSNVSVNTDDIDRTYTNEDEFLENIRRRRVIEYNWRFGNIKKIKVDGEDVLFDLYRYKNRNSITVNKFVLYFDKKKNSIGIKYNKRIPTNSFVRALMHYNNIEPVFEKRRYFVLDVLNDPPFNFSGWNVKIYNNTNNLVNNFVYTSNDCNDKRDKYVIIPDIRIPRRFREYVNLEIQCDVGLIVKTNYHQITEGDTRSRTHDK
ncbi:hypothetical protein BCR32DRAFT_282395 [Anaeromyces robustus]|uniref:Uncharacterized protein n=1 Tax=Anaeromyces robustus TaxID=1754192 RepID=A0A1Y1WXM4_9FUNG|nr:hypothetical protein BCR32DRAFT_282395 [Anaeromyces robustus]|eukprot:ORX78301.1 hypothetical protein BCR32DRAFT_282395 [Anaeromyces robustus]